MKLKGSWKSSIAVSRTHFYYYPILLLLVVSSSPLVSCEEQNKASAEGGGDDRVIKDREPLYESAINLQAVEVDPREVAHLTQCSHDEGHNNDDHSHEHSGSRSVRAYPKYVPELNDGRGQEKSYAFAYAGDDFAHKERREGKVTIGEYSVLLPDGRTQTVRYTADGKEGFKADVTYEGEPNPGTYSKSPTPTPIQYQSSGSVASVQSRAPAPYSQNSYQPEPYRKSYRPVQLNRAGPSQPSPTSQGPIYLSYPLKARRPSVSPSVFYESRPTQAPVVYGSGSGARAPSTVYLASGSNKLSSQYNVSPTPATYKHFYPTITPTPGGYYEQEGGKYQSVVRTPKVIVVSRKGPPKQAPAQTDSGSPYRPIQRGQRAGPDPKRVVLKHGNLHSSKQAGAAYIVQRFNPAPAEPQYDQRVRTVEYFRAGHDVSRSGPLLQEQSVKQVYTANGLSTPAPPVQAYSPTPLPYVDNTLAPLDYRSQGSPVYYQRHERPNVEFSPVKSSVATYTTNVLGVTPKPDLFEVTSSPGVEVGRPVYPSVGGLAYLSGPKPTPRQLGIKKVLSRLPTVSPPPVLSGTKTYELGRPDFGSSVSYTADERADNRYNERRRGSNQLSPLHDGVLNEYTSVQRRIGGGVSGYDGELV